MRRGTLAAAVVAALVFAPAPALAAPGDLPAGSASLLDSPELDELQRRAAAVQADLQRRQARVLEARAALDAARSAAEQAQADIAAADAELARARAEVARHASAVYRDAGEVTALSVLLGGGGPADVVAAAGLLDAAERHAAAVVGAAERRRQEAAARRSEAEEVQATARARATELTGQIAELEAAAAAATRDLEAAVAAADRELGRQREEQRAAGRAAAAAWQDRLGRLAAAGVDPPPAAALRDPAAGAPEGLVPLPAADGGVQAGAAQLPGSPLVVLPAETVTAVSAAVAALDEPYAAGATGPAAWSCGGLVQAVYAAAGVDLPRGQAELYAVTTPVDRADVLPGDLVFLGGRAAGLGNVGIAVDGSTVLAADARAGAVVVGRPAAERVLAVGRPSLGQRAAVAAPGPSAGVLPVECGAVRHPPSTSGGNAWGGFPNGLIPPGSMCSLGVAGHLLRCDAAAAYRELAAAFAVAFGRPLCTTDSYRTYAAQVRLYGEKPELAAVPGTSEHGWGLAVDLCGGIERFGTPEYAWMVAEAGRFGFVHPGWADQGGGREEPWHWEYAGG
ncbi:D-alanyl-D-alanine carboxypeptidase family protein [Geodermatophilus sp. DSM 44513]|uniref:D-alanyl-D-alanine carboxypeptidase family protein n=1 Tax=Geodermatophilus sp. DSM 44513 TaxID=1528104 RepID=UPI00128AD713|nr:D-alanyl-D-alanine carboxypeptidase family protein [Geodermatophilus sp. DSM 44513]WNV77292.1 D-alanyl-D-alanine carboxypeptidase family protein [Geodermatophilus sp. DSM 44513]